MKATKRVPDEMVFYLKDGRTLTNIKELLDALYGMQNDVFYHHVSDERNDFSNWVRDVFGEKKLASQLKRIKTRDGTIKRVKLTIVADLKSQNLKPKAAKKPKKEKNGVEKRKNTKKKLPKKKKTVKKKVKKTTITTSKQKKSKS